MSEPVRLNLLEVCSEKEKAKIKTILNGIPDKYCPVDGGKINGATYKKVTLIGRIKPEKGIWFFLDAIALLPQHILESILFIIIGGAAPGGEQFVKKLEDDIEQHPARKNIKFQAFMPDITGALNETDILVVPSLMKDPFPTTILEGLSAGKPVIATNTGGSIQSIKNKITGFLIEPNDRQMFAERLKELIESDALRIKMGAQAREEFLKSFTFEIFEMNFMNEINQFEQQ